MLESLNGVFSCNSYSMKLIQYPLRIRANDILSLQLSNQSLHFWCNKRKLGVFSIPNSKIESFYPTIMMWPDAHLKIISVIGGSTNTDLLDMVNLTLPENT